MGKIIKIILKTIVKHSFKIIFFVLVLSIIFNLYYSNNSLSSNNDKNSVAAIKIEKPEQNSSKDTKKFSQNAFLDDVISRVKKDYVEEKSDEKLAQAAADGILKSLDPHSSYLSVDDFKEMQVQTSGQFGGVGIEISMENSLIKVISPIEGTPAYTAGIKAGDYISQIDGKSAVDISIQEAVKRLRGKPGSKVNITIMRKNEENPLEFYLKREIVQIKTTRSESYEDVIYIKINSFSGQAYQEVVSNLEKLTKSIGKDKVKGIILDLRNNPGGLLDQSVKVSDIFLDKDQKIVSIKGRNESNNKAYNDSENETITKNIPMVVLINEGSASASEIVAGALQDNKRALILGKKSFGKGSVQSIIPLKTDQGAIRMTTALYYTPSGKSIQAEGIVPDIDITEAKIEKIENKDIARSESGLDGHIKNNNTSKITTPLIDDKNINLYNQDYQLARAIDLVRGISLYKNK